MSVLFNGRVPFWGVALLRVLCLLALPAVHAFAKGELGEWTWRSPLPTGATLYSVASSGTQLVAVGDLGTILTSPDGVDWTARRSGRTATLFSAAWGAGLFVAVGESGTILTSPEGTNWTRRFSDNQKDRLEDVTWCGDQFVAVGGHGVIVTSPDGRNWTRRVSLGESNLRGVARSGNLFLAVGDGEPPGSISDDGVDWQPAYLSRSSGFHDLTWVGSQLVAVGAPTVALGPKGEPQVIVSSIRTSADSGTWVDRVFDLQTSMEDVTWNGRGFVAVGENGVIYASENGESWIKQNSTVEGTLHGVTWSGRRFVAVGEAGTILTSPDGVSWTNHGPPVDVAGLNWVARGGTQLVAVGSGGAILTSLDGATWTSRTSGTAPLLAVTWSGRQFVAVGQSDVILTSPDGLDWSTHPLDKTYWLQGVAWGGSQFVAVGAFGEILSSSDGMSWTRRFSNYSQNFVRVTWGGNQFVAVGGPGNIQTSADGVTWTERFSGTNNQFYDVTWGGDKFVAVGDNHWGFDGAMIATSPDGANWKGGVMAGNALYSVAWSGDQWVAVGAGGTVLSSRDGVNWASYTAGVNSFWSVIWSGTQFIMVGGRGSILTARPIRARPTLALQPPPAGETPGASATFAVTASGTAPVSYQWRVNGTAIAGATDPRFTVAGVRLFDVGTYDVVISDPAGGATSAAAILGVSSEVKVIGDGVEIDDDVTHPNGNVFDQVLLTGPAEAITADWSLKQITRTSFIDLDGDIVQVEFSGPGTLSLVLDGVSGPARPVNYNQAVEYVKGHAGIVITGADERTNVSVFTVGRATAFDPTGAYNLLLPPGAANDPAKNGSPLFQGHAATKYGGVADLAFIAISSRNGKFGGVRAANAHFFADKGLTGLYAPGVVFQGPVYVGDITAFDTATPVLVTGLVGDVRVTGGDLCQDNGAAVEVAGVARLKFVGGATSHGIPLEARSNKAFLEQNGTDVTAQIVVNPVP